MKDAGEFARMGRVPPSDKKVSAAVRGVAFKTRAGPATARDKARGSLAQAVKALGPKPKPE